MPRHFHYLLMVLVSTAVALYSGCGNERPLLDAPDAGPAQCDDRFDELKALLRTLAPDGRSVAGLHRSLGFDLATADVNAPIQGATPGPLLVVKPGAVGWIAAYESSWIRGDLATLSHELATAPATRPRLWWRLDSDDQGRATEFSRDHKGFRNTATGIAEATEPLVAVHPGASWELVTAALRGLSLYGYRSVQMLFSTPIRDGEELARDRTTPALWHPETGLTKLEFRDNGPPLTALKSCPGAYHAVKAMALMGWEGRVKTLAEVLPKALEECQCNADMKVMSASVLGWLNAGDRRATTVAVRVDIDDAPLETIERRLKPYAGQPWVQVSADATRATVP